MIRDFLGRIGSSLEIFRYILVLHQFNGILLILENISDILNKHLGDQNGEVGMRLKESLNQALKDFKDKKDYLN